MKNEALLNRDEFIRADGVSGIPEINKEHGVPSHLKFQNLTYIEVEPVNYHEAVGIINKWFAEQARDLEGALQYLKENSGSHWRIEFGVPSRTDTTVAIEVKTSGIHNKKIEIITEATSRVDQFKSHPAILAKLASETTIVGTDGVLEIDSRDLGDFEVFNQFIRLATDKNRRLPILVLSEDQDGRYIADPEFIAHRCLGIMHVYTLPSRRSYEITELWSKQLSAFNGAARIYNVPFDPDVASPYDHPLILAGDCANEKLEMKIMGILAERLPRSTKMRLQPTAERRANDTHAPSAAELRALLKEEVNLALAPLVERLVSIEGQLVANAVPTSPNAQLIAQVQELERKLQEQRQEADELLRIVEKERDAALDEVQRLRSDSFGYEPPAAEHPYPSTADEMEAWAEANLKGRLLIHPKAIKAARKTAFTDYPRICKALELLSGPYRDSRLGVDGAYDEFVSKLAELRLHPKSSTATPNPDSRPQFFVNFNGDKLPLNKFIRCNEARHNSPKMIRIYYHYHEDTQMIIVGHFPTHLGTL